MLGIGGSGSGKSTFARLVICGPDGDIACNRGFTLIDPRDLQQQVLAHIAELALGPGKATPDRAAQLGDKLLLVEPANQTYGVPGLNVLEVHPGQTPYQIVDGLIETIREIWADSYGPRLEDILRHVALLLIDQNLTLAEAIPCLTSEQFRNCLVQRTQNQELRTYFAEHLGGLRSAELKLWVESTRNKISAFLMNPYIRAILGQSKSTIDFREVLDDGKWAIISISRDRLKESPKLFGALCVALLHNAAVSREKTAAKRRHFHAIHIDEFQETWSPVCLHILEGARAYGLGLHLYHQTLFQEPLAERESIVDTILANTHTLVTFNLARKDSERLAGEVFSPTSSETKHQRRFLGIPTERPTYWSLNEEQEFFIQELMNQRPGEAFIRIKGLRGHAHPFVARVPFIEEIEPDEEKIDILRRHVAAKYYRPVADVEKEIRDRQSAILASGGSLPSASRDYST